MGRCREGSLPFPLSGLSMLPLAGWEGDRVLLSPVWGPGLRGTQRSRAWHLQALSGSGPTAPYSSTVSSLQDALFSLLHLLRLFLKTGLLILTPSPSCSAALEASGWGSQDGHSSSY